MNVFDGDDTVRVGCGIVAKEKYVDRLCSAERKYVSGDKKRRTIMFVGDRGYGFGSTIKGHLKYCGVWKLKIHSLYTSVCETKEHNTSQTCVFCFKKQQPVSVS
ncbi:hypothetical protein EDC94DRAFT_587345 [Helicostylum pulchrum]|nr:hypothetical protein EDC94DRAFT_587345 [Helicostylum pulchrum]